MAVSPYQEYVDSEKNTPSKFFYFSGMDNRNF